MYTVVALKTIPRDGYPLGGEKMWEPWGGDNRDGDTQVYPASDHLRDGKAYCCLYGIIWATSASLQCYSLCLKGLGIPVYIEVPEPPWFYDGVLLVYKVA